MWLSLSLGEGLGNNGAGGIFGLALLPKSGIFSDEGPAVALVVGYFSYEGIGTVYDGFGRLELRFSTF